LSEIVERAAEFARRAHEGQRRKYTHEPYEIHLSAVAGLVRSVGGGSESIVAAWLHDVVEDTSLTREEVGRAFGPRVEQLVVELTDVSLAADGNRASRKALDLAHLAQASPAGQTIKLADLIDNARSIAEHDPRFARIYLAEMEALLQVLVAGDPRLLELARQTLCDCKSGRGPFSPTAD